MAGAAANIEDVNTLNFFYVTESDVSDVGDIQEIFMQVSCFAFGFHADSRLAVTEPGHVNSS